jgi:hypothetical protein
MSTVSVIYDTEGLAIVSWICGCNEIPIITVETVSYHHVSSALPANPPPSPNAVQLDMRMDEPRN